VVSRGGRRAWRPQAGAVPALQGPGGPCTAGPASRQPNPPLPGRASATQATRGATLGYPWWGIGMPEASVPRLPGPSYCRSATQSLQFSDTGPSILSVHPTLLERLRRVR